MTIIDNAELFLGICFILMGLVGTVMQIKFIRRATKTVGVVKKIVHNSSTNDSKDGSFITIGFVHENEDREFIKRGKGFSTYYEGMEVDILYDENDLRSAYVNSILGMFFMELLLLTIGLVMIGIYIN